MLKSERHSPEEGQSPGADENRTTTATSSDSKQINYDLQVGF